MLNGTRKEPTWPNPFFNFKVQCYCNLDSRITFTVYYANKYYLMKGVNIVGILSGANASNRASPL